MRTESDLRKDILFPDKLDLVCPCHKKPMSQISSTLFHCKDQGYWEVDEFLYLYGDKWKEKLSCKSKDV